MQQKNVGGGRLARVGGEAWLGNRGQYWTSMVNLCVGARVMGPFGGDCSLEGGGNACPPPPFPRDGSLVVCPKRAQKTAGWVLGHAPICRVRPRPPLRQISKTDRNIEANL
jgi:hypothetical protein